jgi:hypothetical protein
MTFICLEQTAIRLAEMSEVKRHALLIWSSEKVKCQLHVPASLLSEIESLLSIIYVEHKATLDVVSKRK